MISDARGLDIEMQSELDLQKRSQLLKRIGAVLAAFALACIIGGFVSHGKVDLQSQNLSSFEPIGYGATAESFPYKQCDTLSDQDQVADCKAQADVDERETASALSTDKAWQQTFTVLALLGGAGAIGSFGYARSGVGSKTGRVPAS